MPPNISILIIIHNRHKYVNKKYITYIYINNYKRAHKRKNGVLPFFYCRYSQSALQAFLCVWGAMLAIPFTFVTNALTHHIGTYLGLFNCAICLPQIVAAACGGFILKLIGGAQVGMFIVAAVLLVFGALSVLLINKNN